MIAKDKGYHALCQLLTADKVSNLFEKMQQSLNDNFYQAYLEIFLAFQQFFIYLFIYLIYLFIYLVLNQM